jgi:hypothetical protein
MKTFFKSSELPHIWANGGADYGRCASSLSFQGNILRSYSTDIARIVSRGSVALVNRSSYSVTTRKHQSQAWDAVRHYPHIFELEGLERGEVLRKLTGAQIVDNLTAQAVELAKQATKARGRKEELTQRAKECAAQANAALAVFKVRRQPVDVNALDALGAKLSARQKAAATKRAKEEAQRRAEWLASLQLKLNDWKAGDLPSRGWYNFSELPVALRLITDEDGRLVVETSRGASVLLSQALRLFRYCQALKARGETYNAQGSQNHEVQSTRFQVGPYSLDGITQDGDAVVGCHSLPFAEMERLFLTLTPEQINQSSKAEVAHV